MRRAALLLALVTASCGHHAASTAGDPLASCTGLCGDGPAFAISTVELSQTLLDGTARGFNLDGKVGSVRYDCQADDFVDPDGTPGIDNQLAKLLPVLEMQIGNALPTLIQNSVNEGGLSIIVELVGWGDPARNGTVDVVFHHGTGKPLLGTDGLLLSGQTFQLADEPFMGVARNAHVVGNQVVTDPFEMTLSIVVFGVTYHLAFHETRARILPSTDGMSANMILGGSVSLGDIYAIANQIGGKADNLQSIIQEVLPSFADIIDPATDNCDRISGALVMSARQAYALGSSGIPAR